MAFDVFVLTEPSKFRAPESALTPDGVAASLQAQFAAIVTARGYATVTIQSATVRNDKITNAVTHTLYVDAT